MGSMGEAGVRGSLVCQHSEFEARGKHLGEAVQDPLSVRSLGDADPPPLRVLANGILLQHLLAYCLLY